MSSEYREQVACEIVHPLQAVTDVMTMFITGCRNKKSEMSEVGPVRRGMPGMTARLAPSQQFFTLFLVETMPQTEHSGHRLRSF